MKIRIFYIDAFTEKIFGGNPAAVCILNRWIDDSLMQNIAEENNLSETAFVVKKKANFEIRWFTPKIEVELCGHATLASAHVLFEYYDYKHNEVTFISPYSGILNVKKDKEYLTLDFPVEQFHKTFPPPKLIKGLRKKPIETYRGKTDYMVIYSTQEDIENLNPDFQFLSEIEARGIIVTARGNDVDFVSRFFAPKCGVNEDPVTGSAHTILIPYWSQILNKQELIAIQLSKRRGFLKCQIENDRVKISGKVATYLVGKIEIPN
jgi:PhzF family phenazine biosynthesis protein